MRVLLPPSETKRPGGGTVVSEQIIDGGSPLHNAHVRVKEALINLSLDTDAAAKALKLGVKSRAEIEHNLRLDAAERLPAVERYTGVIFDAIDVGSLAPHERAWLDDHVFIQSALFGLISASTPIPAYRLSASTRLPNLGEPLKRVWTVAHDAYDWGEGLIVDLRSNDYAALAPIPTDHRCVRVDVVQVDADGSMRSLNHFNKRAKGELVRSLARSGPVLDTLEELIEWGNAHGHEFVPGDHPPTLRLVQRVP